MANTGSPLVVQSMACNVVEYDNALGLCCDKLLRRSRFRAWAGYKPVLQLGEPAVKQHSPSMIILGFREG